MQQLTVERKRKDPNCSKTLVALREEVGASLDALLLYYGSVTLVIKLIGSTLLHYYLLKFFHL